jgi:hypothetical protein
VGNHRLQPLQTDAQRYTANRRILATQNCGFALVARSALDISPALILACVDAMTLPESFPPGTRFFDVKGLPVSLCNGQAQSWGPTGKRWFNAAFLLKPGKAVSLSEAGFRNLVSAEASY